jgi:hypothetical protein
MITALLPPNSNSDLPSLAPTLAATSLPIRVDPVAETNGIRWSSDIHFPTEASPFTRQEMPSGKLFSLRTLVINFWQATPHSGAFHWVSKYKRLHRSRLGLYSNSKRQRES